MMLINMSLNQNGWMNNMPRIRKNTFEIFDNYVLVGFDNYPDIKFMIDIEDYEKYKDDCFYPSIEEWGNYLKIYTNKKLYRYARLVMNATYKEYVDHIFGNTQDNRKINLRITTNQKNGFNHKLSKKNTSGFSGVGWDRIKEFWVAKIRFNYKNIHLGYFTDKNDAIRCRLQAELKYFGIDFAPQRHLFQEYGII